MVNSRLQSLAPLALLVSVFVVFTLVLALGHATEWSNGDHTLGPTMCAQMQGRHGVVPGKSWGTLPIALQRRWDESGCDRALERAAGGPWWWQYRTRTAATHPKRTGTKFGWTVHPDKYGQAYLVLTKGSCGEHTIGGCDTVRAQCCGYNTKYGMVPSRTWGSTPSAEQAWHSANSCDSKMGGTALTECPYTCTGASSTPPAAQLTDVDGLGACWFAVLPSLGAFVDLEANLDAREAAITEEVANVLDGLAVKLEEATTTTAAVVLSEPRQPCSSRIDNHTLTLNSTVPPSMRCDRFEPPVVLRADAFQRLRKDGNGHLTELTFLQHTLSTRGEPATVQVVSSHAGGGRRFPAAFLDAWEPVWKQHSPNVLHSCAKCYPTSYPTRCQHERGDRCSSEMNGPFFAHERYLFAVEFKIVRVVRDRFRGGAGGGPSSFVGVEQWWLVPSANFACGRGGAVWGDVSDPSFDGEPICLGHFVSRIAGDVVDFHKAVDPQATSPIARGGTAFGAMRFQAVLPWDQDVDFMPCKFDQTKWGNWAAKGWPAYDFGHNHGMYRGFPRWPAIKFIPAARLGGGKDPVWSGAVKAHLEVMSALFNPRHVKLEKVYQCVAAAQFLEWFPSKCSGEWMQWGQPAYIDFIAHVPEECNANMKSARRGKVNGREVLIDKTLSKHYDSWDPNDPAPGGPSPWPFRQQWVGFGGEDVNGWAIARRMDNGKIDVYAVNGKDKARWEKRAIEWQTEEEEEKRARK